MVSCPLRVVHPRVPALRGWRRWCFCATIQGGDLRAALDGPDGKQYLWRGRGAAIAADIACGLAYIHTTGVVHRCARSEVYTSLCSLVLSYAKQAECVGSSVYDDTCPKCFPTLSSCSPALPQ